LSKLHLFKWLIFTSKFHLFARQGTVLLAQPIGTALVHMYPTALLVCATQSGNPNFNLKNRSL
jgi:hypothetical protein